MSGWGGAQIAPETYAVADQVTRTYGLTIDQREVLVDVTHTLTFHQTYSHAELPAMLGKLFEPYVT